MAPLPRLPQNLLALLATAALLTAAGCSFVSPPPEIPVALPAGFHNAGEAVLPEQWWRSFADADLDPLIEQALAGNFGLAATWARLDQADAAARKAGAARWPQLEASGSASRNRERSNSVTELSSSHRLGLAASYELDLWGRIDSLSEAAALDAGASAAELRSAAISLSAEVASSWYRLVEQRGQLALLERQLQLNEQVLELVTLRFRTGRVGAVDVLQQQQLVEARRGEMARVRQALASEENALAILVGSPPGSLEFPARAELFDLPELPAAGVPADLVQRRPDLQSAWLKLMAADQRTAAAVADRFPRLTLGADATTSAADLADLFDDWLARLAAGFVAPLIDGGQRRAEVDRSRAVAAERLADYGDAVLNALGEVEDALARERYQQEYLQSLDKQLLSSGQALERLRDNYIRGSVDYLRVLDTLNTNQSLERTRLTARRQQIQERINLCRALAGGWSLDRPASRHARSAESSP